MRHGYKTPIEEYADKHPGCTLQEYIDLENSNKERINEEERVRANSEEEYQKSLEGKCFKLDFNGNCIIYFRLMSSPKMVVYETYSDRGKPYSMTVEIGRTINLLWLPNPYRATNYCDTLAVEIEESEFLRITQLFEEFQNIFKQIRDSNN